MVDLCIEHDTVKTLVMIDKSQWTLPVVANQMSSMRHLILLLMAMDIAHHPMKIPQELTIMTQVIMLVEIKLVQR
jgi:hypothetical protein